LFTVQGLANGLDHARLGVTVSRKVALRANRRNRIKRHIRESFRMHQPALRGLDIVVVARSPANQAEAGTLRESLEKHWIVIKAQCKPRSSS
jgi:ribonuclease P protein component